MTRRADNEALIASVISFRAAAREGGLTAAERARRERVYRTAANALVAANMDLVWSFAHRFTRRVKDLAVDDLVQEGAMGLMKAVERFDPERGTSLGTYAGWWIQSFIRLAVENGDRAIRIPVHLNDARKRIYRAREAEFARLGREPTDDEIAAALKISPRKVAAVRDVEMGRLASLDTPVGEDSIAWVELMAGDGERPDEACERTERERQAATLLATLMPRTRALMQARMDGETLAEAGKPYGISKERVRQLEARAIDSMRTFARRRKVGT
jgi:RNA polymerase primary sigma factor